MEEWKLFLVFQLNHCVCALDDPSSYCECLHFPAVQHHAVRTWNRAVLTLNQPTNQPLLQTNQINQSTNWPTNLYAIDVQRQDARPPNVSKRSDALATAVGANSIRWLSDRLRKWKAPPSARCGRPFSAWAESKKPNRTLGRANVFLLLQCLVFPFYFISLSFQTFRPRLVTYTLVFKSAIRKIIRNVSRALSFFLGTLCDNEIIKSDDKGWPKNWSSLLSR